MKQLLLILCLLCAPPANSQTPSGARRQPGGSPGGGFLLPNGWTVTPAGEQIPAGDLPLALLLHPDGKQLLVSNNGNGPQSIQVIDAIARQTISTIEVAKAWLGLALSEDGKKIYAGGGLSNAILTFALEGGKITPTSPIPIGAADADIFPGGLCVAGRRLYVANNLANTVTAVDLTTGTVLASVDVGDHPYTCIATHDGKTVYASIWGAAQVAVLETNPLRVSARISTDDHPNAMALSRDGKRLFVANANSNTISAIDLAVGKAVERLSVALYPNSPAGSTTNALALSPDGTRLYAANADNNDVAVIDIAKPGESRVLGFIPVGWYHCPGAERGRQDAFRREREGEPLLP